MSVVTRRYAKKINKIGRKIAAFLSGQGFVDPRQSGGKKGRLHGDADDLSLAVRLVYNHYLHRDPDPEGLRYYREALAKGLSLRIFASQIAESSEGQRKNAAPADADGGLGQTDGEFLLSIGEILLEATAARPKEMEFLKRYLREHKPNRELLIQRLVDEHIGRRSAPEIAVDHNRCWIMGTEKFLTKEIWQEEVARLDIDGSKVRAAVPLEQRHFQHSGRYRVSAIASLYRGRKFLEDFLENIVSQSIFAESELIIVDADSPEGEGEIIERYMKVYPNIIYKRMNYRTGIYDAWNVGCQLARGDYLTNTNLDDLRRHDSLELQADTLDKHAFVDVVYQDFFYSLDSSFSFEQVAKCNFRSHLPVVTVNNMMEFNSPHNAPMWRRQLHDDVGYFDTSFRSAGDYEFWLRCLLHKKQFLKINTPHVVYFQNPEGISTAPDSRGIEEARRIWRRYAARIVSPYLVMPRGEFSRAVGLDGSPEWDVVSYELVQRGLRALSDSSKSASADKTIA